MLESIQKYFQNESKNALSVDKARLTLYLEQAPIGVWSGIVGSFIVVYVTWGFIDTSTLLTWITLLILGSIYHLILIQRINNKFSNTETSINASLLSEIERSLMVSSLFGGVLFGFLGYMIQAEWPITVQLFVVLYAGGAVAGALGSNISSLSIYYAFITPILFLTAIGLARFVPMTTIILLIYYIAMVLTARKTNKAVIESLTLRLDNLDLIENLTKNNDKQGNLLKKLRKSEQFATGAFNNAGVAMALIDADTQIFKVNQAACELFKFSESALLGKRFTDASRSDKYSKNIQLFQELVSGKRHRYHSTDKYLQGDGKKSIWVEVVGVAVTDEQGEFDYAVMHIQDVTQEHKLTQKLSYQAEHDSLTGLPNRFAFETKLQALLDERNNAEHVLCYLDLDQFKVVNDTCGHIAGDELLKQISVLLKQSLRDSDLLARIGGDEFAVILFNCSLDSAVKQLEKVLLNLQYFRFIYEEQSFNVGISIGIVKTYTNSTLIDLLKQADSACYAAKDAGRNRLHIYRHDDKFLAQRAGEMAWVTRIQHAIEHNKFVLFHQKIERIAEKEQRPHYELLIRMLDDEGAIIPPGLFLPAAERYNLAADIDIWVIEHVINTLVTAISEGKNVAGIYGVNLSGQSLGDVRFYEKIRTIISDNDLRETGAIICFEITETAAISNITAALWLMTELRELGCQFALDDFGSGLSSFAYLKQMPIDYLKIDGMFVKDCLTDPVNLEMITSINGIGQVMGLKTIAEFVENKDIFTKLGELGVDYAQGYWNGVPKPWVIGHRGLKQKGDADSDEN
jgi:diguanylate cyclase (GGDEF)-like protein/PAS domain S-box-containing protein